MWHKVERQTDEMGLKAELTTFVPYTQDKVELTKVTITNTADTTQKITSTVAIPMYARSASNIRDHRHVTSLLHRTFTIKDGIMIYPTLTFDERGHNKNTVFYGALAKEMTNGKMESPVSFCPVTEEFIGEGGNFENPYYVAKNKPLPYTMTISVICSFQIIQIKPNHTIRFTSIVKFFKFFHRLRPVV